MEIFAVTMGIFISPFSSHSPSFLVSLVMFHWASQHVRAKSAHCDRNSAHSLVHNIDPIGSWWSQWGCYSSWSLLAVEGHCTANCLLKYSVADSVLIKMLIITRMVANKFGPCALSVLQAMVMEVEVLVVASHLTQTLLPCTLILEVCSDWKNDTQWGLDFSLLINSGGM
jgi:hypothetical protein